MSVKTKTRKLESLWYNVQKKRYQRRHKSVPAFLKGRSEKYFLEKVVKYFEDRGWKAHHHDTNNPRHAWVIGPGFPDLVLVKKVRRRNRKTGKYRTVVKIIWAELKTERGYPTATQKEWLDLLPQSNTFLWRPSHWLEIKYIARS